MVVSSDAEMPAANICLTLKRVSVVAWRMTVCDFVMLVFLLRVRCASTGS